MRPALAVMGGLRAYRHCLRPLVLTYLGMIDAKNDARKGKGKWANWVIQHEVVGVRLNSQEGTTIRQRYWCAGRGAKLLLHFLVHPSPVPFSTCSSLEFLKILSFSFHVRVRLI